MTNELGTTLQDIESKAGLKHELLKQLNDMTNIASNYAPDVYYEWLQASHETIRKYIEEN